MGFPLVLNPVHPVNPVVFLFLVPWFLLFLRVFVLMIFYVFFRYFPINPGQLFRQLQEDQLRRKALQDRGNLRRIRQQLYIDGVSWRFRRE